MIAEAVIHRKRKEASNDASVNLAFRCCSKTIDPLGGYVETLAIEGANWR